MPTVTPLRILDAYDRAPDFLNFLGDKDRELPLFRDIYFGIELEVNFSRNFRNIGHDYYERAMHAVAGVMDGKVIFADDGSIPCGFEIKTAPALYEYQREMWAPFFDLMETQRPRIFQRHNHECGIHIHISKDGLTTGHMNNLCYFIHNPHNNGFIEDIAERDHLYEFRSDILRPSHSQRRLNVRSAIHLANDNTAEIRIFRSTTVRAEFYKNLEFVHALIRFTKRRVGNQHAEKLTHEKFMEWLAPKRVEYTNLWNFLNPSNPVSLADRLEHTLHTQPEPAQAEEEAVGV